MPLSNLAAFTAGNTTSHSNSIAPPPPAQNRRDTASFENGFLADALDRLPTGFAVFDGELRMIYCNKVLQRMLNYPPQLFSFGTATMEQIFRHNAERGEYGDVNVEDFVASKMALARKREKYTYERRRPNGTILEVRGEPLENGGFTTIYLDVSAHKATASTPTAVDLGDIDKLTGLPAGKSVRRYVSACQRALKHGEKACIMTIDLAHFSGVNERFGRIVGDFVLREIAIRLSNTIRGTDYLGRTGSDRFTVVHPVILRPSDTARLAGRMVNEIKRPIICNANAIEVSAVVDFTLFDRDTRDIEKIMACGADTKQSVTLAHSSHPKNVQTTSPQQDTVSNNHPLL